MNQELITISKEEFEDLARKIELKKNEIKILSKSIKEIEREGLVVTQEQITITKKDWESMKETFDILNDPETMKDIRESEEAIKKGVKGWEIKF